MRPQLILRTGARFHLAMHLAVLAALVALAALDGRRIAALGAAMLGAAGSPSTTSAILVAGILAGTAVHEFAHAVPLWAAGVPVRFGVAMVRGVPVGAYCRAEAPVPRAIFLASLAAPQVAVPLAAAAAVAAVPRAEPFGVTLCLLNVLGSVGDAAFAWAVLRCGAAAFVEPPDGSGLAAVPLM